MRRRPIWRQCVQIQSPVDQVQKCFQKALYRLGLGAMNAQPVEIPHHLLDHLQRIGYIHHQPAVANESLRLAPERRDVLRRFKFQDQQQSRAYALPIGGTTSSLHKLQQEAKAERNLGPTSAQAGLQQKMLILLSLLPSSSFDTCLALFFIRAVGKVREF
jgi:hypothetical protein